MSAVQNAGLNGADSRPGELLKTVRKFKYLGRIVSCNDNDTTAVRRNIKKARWTWGQFWKVIKKEEVPPRAAGMFYQAVVVSVLLYGSESWVVSPAVMRELERFHVEAARRLTSMCPRKVKGE